MCEPICTVVGRLSYARRPRVAADAAARPQWHLQRWLLHPNADLRRPVWLHPVKAVAVWSAKHRGPLRHESAESVTHLAVALLRGGTPPADILVLTPFRAQRTLLRQSLRRADIAGVAVSTVHKAPGSERRTLLFDPVDGGSPFLQSEGGAPASQRRDFPCAGAAGGFPFRSGSAKPALRQLGSGRRRARTHGGRSC